MGWNSQAVIANKVIVTGSGEGVFAYDPEPGPGTLVISVAATGGTDEFGNAYLAGLATYQYAGLVPVNAVSASDNDVTFWTWASGWVPESGISLISLFTLGISSALTVGGTVTATGGTPASPTVIATDTWHAVAVDAGWTTPFASAAALSYSLGPDRMVHITGGAQFNANFTSQAINSGSPLPAAYRPVTEKRLPGAELNATINVGTNGVLTAVSAAAGQDMFCESSYPLGI